MTVYTSVLEMIGNTPIVDVSQLSPNPDVRILGKMEGQNPAGSVKDRIALSMITEAEEDGTLSPGCTIIEPSSGNTGIAMAMICRIKGYHLKIVLPGNVSPERRQLLEVFGAEIIDSPGAEGSNGAVRMAQGLADDHPEWVFLYQYANEANPKAHYRTTGPEIWADVPEITHFVAGLGTSGTLMGVGTFLKEQNPAIKVLAVEPPTGEQVEGLRSLEDGYIPPVFDKWGGYELLDGKSIVRPVSRSSTPVPSPASACSPASRRARRWPVPARWPPRSSPARSCSSCATTAGSTCRPVPGRWTSTRPRPTPRRSSTSRSSPGCAVSGPRAAVPVGSGSWTTGRSACSTPGSEGSPWPGP